MPRSSWIVSPEHWDTARVIADINTIRQYNPQRFEMEQSTIQQRDAIGTTVAGRDGG